tara:strand:- start:2 stop:481 length:480 start_codon:yes stop_codon:yes gene_type:complete
MAKSESKLKEISYQLSKEFPHKDVKWRVGRLNRSDGGKTALMLAYIDARIVQNRLDEVVGFENWQCKHISYGPKTICHLGIKLNGEWIWKSDGAGDTNVEADKGAISDSLKRAAVHFGIGRYLYDFPKVWARVKEEKGYKVPDINDCWDKYRAKKSIIE